MIPRCMVIFNKSESAKSTYDKKNESQNEVKCMAKTKSTNDRSSKLIFKFVDQ